MYFDDHSPPHFHAFYAEQEAEIGIDSLGLLAGRLPPRAFANGRRVGGRNIRMNSDTTGNSCHTSQLPVPIGPLE